ncbi:MAG TPA: DUF3572 domain-containing protein [Rhizomicrobium sp.]|jgi:hypothetical protein|nr:DUF3572 domain-containing protein [Rhizomicrobium sp.]
MGTRPDPELLALRALGFLAETPDNLARFLSLSGATPADLRAHAEDPQFLGGVLDFLLGDDDMVRHFCAVETIDPQTVHLARHRLSGSRTD